MPFDAATRCKGPQCITLSPEGHGPGDFTTPPEISRGQNHLRQGRRGRDNLLSSPPELTTLPRIHVQYVLTRDWAHTCLIVADVSVPLAGQVQQGALVVVERQDDPYSNVTRRTQRGHFLFHPTSPTRDSHDYKASLTRTRAGCRAAIVVTAVQHVRRQLHTTQGEEKTCSGRNSCATSNAPQQPRAS